MRGRFVVRVNVGAGWHIHHLTDRVVELRKEDAVYRRFTNRDGYVRVRIEPQMTRQQALDAERQQKRETYLRLGAIRAAQGHAGGAAGEGSVLDVLGDVAAQSELERQQVLYEGELKARGFSNTATLDRYSGAAAQTGSYFKAGSELLGGAGSSYSAYQRSLRRG